MESKPRTVVARAPSAQSSEYGLKVQLGASLQKAKRVKVASELLNWGMVTGVGQGVRVIDEVREPVIERVGDSVVEVVRELDWVAVIGIVGVSLACTVTELVLEPVAVGVMDGVGDRDVERLFVDERDGVSEVLPVPLVVKDTVELVVPVGVNVLVLPTLTVGVRDALSVGVGVKLRIRRL